MQHGSELGDVCGGVTHGDVSVLLTVPVCLQVSGCGLDIWCCKGLVGEGNDFVSDEEARRVIKTLEGIHDCSVRVELCLVP